MGIFDNWSRRRATKKMAAPLLAELSVSYGGSEYYTIPQIRTAFQKLRLNAKFIDIAFSQFLEFDAYDELTGMGRASYDNGRSLYQRYLPDSGSSSWEPAPLNEYIPPFR